MEVYAMNDKERPVLVTTVHRGVFFGFLESRDGNSVTLTNARCAIRWETSGGFLELADIGPNSLSKIGSVAPRIELFDVTSITDITPQAVERWLAI
jgi:hypothetical protein